MSGRLSRLTWGGLTSALVVTTNSEKSAEAIVVPKARRAEPKGAPSPY